MQENLPPQRDTLYVMNTPDAVAKELRSLVKGKSNPKLYRKAYDLYQTPSTRYLIESILFVTKSVEDAAAVLDMNKAHLLVYSQCFFDVSVFEDDTCRVLYLDKYAQIDIAGAEMMRNAMGLDKNQLLFLANQANAGRVSPKEALEEGLKLFYNLMRVFIKPQIEQVMQTTQDEKAIERFDRLFTYATACASQVRGFSDQLLKYELDKTSENFMEEFAIALEKKPLAQLISPRVQDDKNAPELI